MAETTGPSRKQNPCVGGCLLVLQAALVVIFVTGR